MVDRARTNSSVANEGHGDAANEEQPIAISWQAVVDAVSRALCVLDPDGRILYFNSRARRFFGHALAPVAGREFADTLLPITERAEFRSTLERVRSGVDTGTIRCTGESTRAESLVSVSALRGRHGFDGFLLEFDRVNSRVSAQSAGGDAHAATAATRSSPDRIELARQQSLVARRQSIKPRVSRNGIRTARVLVVEDNPTNQLVAVGVLRKLGFTVDAVDNGVEAVKTLELNGYDLVLMDLEMPELDGFETTRFLRARGSDAQNQAIPIVAMSAHSTPQDKRKCLEVGMNDHLAKPITPESLASIVDKWLPGGMGGPSATACVSESKQVVAKPRAPEQPSTDLEPSLPVFIESALIERLLDDRSLAWSIVQGFLEDMPIQIQVLERELALGNASTARQQAHRIKGAAATVSAEALRQAASDFEQAGLANDNQEMVKGLLALRQQFARLEVAMNQSSLAATAKKSVHQGTL